MMDTAILSNLGMIEKRTWQMRIRSHDRLRPE
jgi:hypothetical protein